MADIVAIWITANFAATIILSIAVFAENFTILDFIYNRIHETLTIGKLITNILLTILGIIIFPSLVIVFVFYIIAFCFYKMVNSKWWNKKIGK